MRLLLDTHVFLWYIAADAHLPVPFRDAIKDVQNEVFVSVASIWEAVIKAQIGKLAFPASPSAYLRGQRRHHLMESLVIDEGTVDQVSRLPALHRDPFDRVLIAQAVQHDLKLLTVDKAILAQGLQIF